MARSWVVATALLIGAVAQGAGQSRSAPSVPLLLERYARGEDAAADLARLDAQGWNAVLAGFESAVPSWMQHGSPAEAAHRRRLAAAFAIEATAVVLESPNRLMARRILAWICPAMRRAPLDEFTHAWWRASIVVLQRSEDWDLILGTGGDAELKDGHLAHARAAYGTDAWLDLAEAVAREGRSWAGTPANLTALSRAGAPAGRVEELERLARAFAALKAHPALWNEASLRLAMTNLRRGQPDPASFAGAARSASDPFVASMGWLMSGVILQQQGSVDAAIASYSRALGAAPKAQSAGTMLVAALASTGRVAQAREQAEALLGGEVAPDPWRQYRLGAGRDWPLVLQALRERAK